MLVSVVLCAVLSVVPDKGPHTMEKSHIKMALPSGPGSHRVDVYYPSDLEGGPYPVVGFAHGMLAGGATGRPVYHHLIEKIVSLGMVVVAPESCLLAYCSGFYRDQLAAINATHNSSLHEAFAHVDTTRAGVIGHSMGGEATEHNAGHEGYGIRAAAAVHPVSKAEWGRDAKVPVFYTTGNLDVQAPAKTVEEAYNATTLHGSWFANLEGATHYEPTDFTAGRLDIFAALFLHCHLADNATSCAQFEDNLCGAYDFVKCVSK
eukprot:TRINITY_DN56_c0_g1_i1.p1 TRINITY_DN56_c0_g1~~TRINITY_DN56_c0_g1_i1.p1  ORF type:complete len:262 (+),score=107.42 TRINITY_DN56_c0_g1_i1:82-867(+)